jgi:hypothetical protein
MLVRTEKEVRTENISGFLSETPPQVRKNRYSKREMIPLAKKNSKDWRNLPIEEWNAATFMSFMNEKHQEKFGIPYVPSSGNYGMDMGMVKNFFTKYGKEATRLFIEMCIDEKKPNPRYPSLNFAFMKKYMEAQVLPRALALVAKEQKREERKKNQKEKLSVDDMLDML